MTKIKTNVNTENENLFKKLRVMFDEGWYQTIFPWAKMLFINDSVKIVIYVISTKQKGLWSVLLRSIKAI